MTALDKTGFREKGFRHEALFYGDEDDFLAGTVPFVREGLTAGEPVLVALGGAGSRALAGELGGEARDVGFIDMLELGRNPARIIPAWRQFVDDHGGEGQPIRGIGEPIWAGRTEAELAECRHHESLLNRAFADTQAFSLLCPYDAEALDERVLYGARCTHPFLSEVHTSRPSDAYLAPDLAPGPFEGDLSPASEQARELTFTAQELRAVRHFVSDEAAGAGLEDERKKDLVLAVSEVSTNSVLHAGGEGTLRIWRENGSLLCDVSDSGRLEHPLLGRERPTTRQERGRGLWLVNQLCDLVQMRSFPEGNVVRLHMSLAPES
jgi:anti-sigma regulatory factor (Ser/Thr protein kinase)